MTTPNPNPTPGTTGKHRASRIPLDYYKQGDRMSRRKVWFTRLFMWATIGWTLIVFPACLISEAKKTPLGEERFSHGPVCRGHKNIGAECSACHVSFPMLGARVELSPNEMGGRSTFKGDLKCVECHLGVKSYDKMTASEAIHHPNIDPAATPNCGTCHQDHKGADHDMRRVAEANCVGCHKDLKQAVQPGQLGKYEVSVTDFTTNHPKLRSLPAKDPSKLKFNHAYHMTKGISLYQNGKPYMVSEMLDGVQRQALIKRGQTPSSPVQLDCIDCHNSDERYNDRGWKDENGSLVDAEGRSIAAPEADVKNKEGILAAFNNRRKSRAWVAEEGVMMPPRGVGSYMAPINYDQHCSSCHPLTALPGMRPLPHRLPVIPDPEKYVLNRKVFEAMEEEGIPEPAIKALRPLLDVAFAHRGDFEKKLADLLPKSQLKHEERIVELANQRDVGLRAAVENVIDDARPIKVAPPAIPFPWKQTDVTEPDRKAKVDLALRTLLEGNKNCGECHIARDGMNLSYAAFRQRESENQAILAENEKIRKQNEKNRAENKPELPYKDWASYRVERPAIPELWLKHARFDHLRHTEKGISCKECHPQAYASNPQMLLDAFVKPRKGAEDIMIPSIDVCRNCHSSSPKKEIVDRGVSAKHDCTECHIYHHGLPKK